MWNKTTQKQKQQSGGSQGNLDEEEYEYEEDEDERVCAVLFSTYSRLIFSLFHFIPWNFVNRSLSFHSLLT